MTQDVERANGRAPLGSPSPVEVLTTTVMESSSRAGDASSQRTIGTPPQPSMMESRGEGRLADEGLNHAPDSDRAGVIAALANKIRTRLSSKMPDAVQTELATLLGLVPEATGSNSLCLCEFEIAVDALLADTPKLELARGLRMKFEEQMWKKRFGGRLVRALPGTRVVFGLLLTSILLIPAVIWSTYMHFSDSHPETMDADLLVLVCCFGAFGAMTSIMVRLRSFDSIHAPPLTLFLTGLFRPFIGALFAAFALVLVESRVLNLPDATLVYFALAIAFVAGFSERFGEDLTTMVAKKIEPAQVQAASSS